MWRPAACPYLLQAGHTAVWGTTCMRLRGLEVPAEVAAMVSRSLPWSVEPHTPAAPLPPPTLPIQEPTIHLFDLNMSCHGCWLFTTLFDSTLPPAITLHTWLLLLCSCLAGLLLLAPTLLRARPRLLLLLHRSLHVLQQLGRG